MVSVEIVKGWKKIVNNYPFPKDDIERAKFQFECLYMVRLSKGQETYWNLFRWNMVAFIVTPPLLLLFLFNNFRNVNKIKKTVVFTCPDKRYSFVSNDLPAILTERYGLPEIVDEKKVTKYGIYANSLDRDAALLIFKTILRYPFKFFMILGLLVNISRYCTIVKKYTPKALIVVQVERYYTTSVLTQYCEAKDIKHICIQHGDYFYDPCSAFFRVSEYYAWNDETIRQFEMVKSNLGECSIYTPKRLTPTLKKREHPQYYITYYLQNNDLNSLIRISELLCRFVKSGYRCCVRKHPRFTLPNQFEQLFQNAGVVIEPPEQVNLKESLCNTEYVVAHYSTVLTEAIINGMNAVIDDYTESLEILQELCYTNISMTSLRLSTLVKDAKI